MSDFESAKRAFSDVANKTHFIKLDVSIGAYNRIVEGLKEDAYNIILLYGPPGSGKSFMLNSVYETIKSKRDVLFLGTPFHTPQEFMQHVFAHFLNKQIDSTKNDKVLINQFLKEYQKKEAPVIILDEIQLYEEKNLEFLRLVSDLKRFKFILSLHKTKKEDIFAREYFSSRIWDAIELRRLNHTEAALYIQKRLLNYKAGEMASKINGKNAKLINDLSLGNFRNINKLMYKTFDICDYFDKNRPTRINAAGSIDSKFIEMAAIDLGLLRA